jgi:hypothetical protein
MGRLYGRAIAIADELLKTSIDCLYQKIKKENTKTYATKRILKQESICVAE